MSTERLTELGIGPGSLGEEAALERDIDRCVRLFYAKAQNDTLLGPLFERSIHDWEHHFGRIRDFWSRVLLGTARYSGHPYPVHTGLPVEPEHFSRWVSLFEEAARETLPAPHALQAIEKARHMSTSFQAGIFPFTDSEGRPARLPYQAVRAVDLSRDQE